MNRYPVICVLLLIVLCFCGCTQETTLTSSSQPDQISQPQSQVEDSTIPMPATMTFGSYYSYKNGLTDKSLEDITWYILAEENNKLLLCSKQALFHGKFHSKTTEKVTWSTSELREKLNNEFYNIAFSDTQKQRICNTQLNDSNTTDKVFLLSQQEADTYMPESVKYNCQVKEYMQKMNLIPTYGENHACKWWLRSAGTESEYIRYMGYNNQHQTTQGTPNNTLGVRPAIWITKE